jgi:hypothetical protein
VLVKASCAILNKRAAYAKLNGNLLSAFLELINLRNGGSSLVTNLFWRLYRLSLWFGASGERNCVKFPQPFGMLCDIAQPQEVTTLGNGLCA